MNILQVADGNVRIPPVMGGGTEGYVLGISKALAKMGNRVVILDRKYTSDDPQIEQIDGVVIVRLKSPRLESIRLMQSSNKIAIGLGQLINTILYALVVRLWVNRNPEFEIINFHDVLIGLAFVLASGKRGVVYTQHGLSYEKSARDPPTELYGWLRSLLLHRINAVVTLNPVSMQCLKQEIRGRRALIQTIPVGVDVSSFNLIPEKGNDVVIRYNLRGRLVLSVGRISEEKGTDVLMRAAGILVRSRHFSDTTFVVVGPINRFGTSARSSKFFGEVVKVASSLRLGRNVKFLGNVPREDLIGLYSNCDIFVLPSLKENFSQALLEAMAAGKPIVASRLPGTVPQVRDGWNGFLTVPGHDGMLADRIAWLLDNEDEAKLMGDRSRRLVEERFSNEVVGQSLASLYLSCAKNGGP